jgi:hypothetical protein
MFNKISTFFQFGSNTQTNIISINPRIDVTIKRIEKDFFDGNFKQAIDDLDSLITDSSNEALKSVKYQLLILKANFLMQFRQINEFQELLEHIEKEYKNFIEIKFKELTLTLMAFNKNQEFFEFSKQLRIETPNSKSQSHFDILFYLNSGDILKAKELFEEEIKNTQYRKHLLLIGGHIYSNLYDYYGNDMKHFEQADLYYRELLQTEVSFLDKLHIKGFYAIYLLNKYLQNKIPRKDLLFTIDDYKNPLDIILKNEEYFNAEYIKTVIENYIHIIPYSGSQDEYRAFYKKYDKYLSIKHYIQYCDIDGTDYDHNKIQKYILDNYQVNDLLVYTSLIFNCSNTTIEEIVKFLQNNIKFLYEHGFIIYSYVKGQILLSYKMDEEIIKYLDNNKYNNLDILLAFIESKNYVNIKIQDENIDKLIEFSLDENNIQARILDVIKLLKKLGKRKEYLHLALSKQNVFNGIIFETLKICEKDKNLYFKDFEDFVSNMENKDYYNVIIGNIYVKHDRLDKALNYYYLESKRNNNKEAMIALLQVSWDNFHISHKIIENSKQIEIFNLLIVRKEHLKLEDLIFLLMYSIHILKDTRQILPIVNQELLNLDIQNLDNSLKVSLSDIFTQTSFGILSNYNDMFLYDSNLCLVQDGKTYIQNNYIILEENKNNFGLYLIDDNEYFLKEQDNIYKKKSLFHRIVGPFAFQCENPNMFEMKLDENSKEPLHELFDFMSQQTNYTKDLFQRYSDEKFRGLYALANKNYKNYFTLIPYLLNSKTMNFNSLHVNYLPNEKKKILTLSSIIFLSEINQLEIVLKRDDIVIQQTFVNWLKDYSQTIDYTNMPQDFTYLDEKGHKFIPFTDDSIKQAESFKASIFKIINVILKCKIIDDTSENLPIKETYSMLAPHIGNQEYKALAYCVNHNYQIISENNVFGMLFDTMKYNKVFISNSISLLTETLKNDIYRNLIIDLHMKRYKYVLNDNYVNGLLNFMKKHDISDLLDEEKELIKIASSYGFLDKIKQYYRKKFKVIYPKSVLPTKTSFDKNIEKVFKIIGSEEL